jgi:hypothetical protein
MAEDKQYLDAVEKLKKAKAAYDAEPNKGSAIGQQKLREYYAARRDVTERTPAGALGAGMLRTFGETVTGIPDLLTEAGNWLAKKAGAEYQAPTLGGLFRQATGQSEGPKTEDLSGYYNTPGYVAAGAGLVNLGMLAKDGWKAFKDAKIAKKADELLGELNPTERNLFSKWMVRGQGSTSPEVAAMLEKVRTNPKYSELFSALEQEAGKSALKGIRPTGGAQTPEEAAGGIARTIQNKLDAVKKARAEAGSEAFDKAFKQAGDAAFVETNNTRAVINKLRSEYPDNDAVQAYLSKLEDKLIPTINVSPSKGTSYVVRQGEPSRTIPGAPARVDKASEIVTEYDAFGLPRQRTVTRDIPVAGYPSKTVAGTPDVMGNIPGRQGFSVQAEPEKLTIQRLQGFLHEFGKKAEGSDSVVTGLSLDDMKRVNASLFSGLKTDLAETVRTAGSVAEKKAAGYLIQAREQFRKASEDYDNLIAQGVPKWLKGKALNEVTLEELTQAYQKTNPSQRQLFRDWVGESRAESLKAIDKAVFDDFLADTYKKLPDGSFGYDLGSIADKWQTIKATDPNKAGQIADALGVDANEFSKRMKDASVFTRKIQIGATKADDAVIPQNMKTDLAAAVGATPAGYQGAKVAQLSIDAVNEIFKKKGLSEEQLMKILLTPEGKDFLKTAAISPQSARTLEALSKVENPASFSLPAFSTLAAPSATAPKEAPVAEPTWALPPEMQSTSESAPAAPSQDQQWALPPELQ